MTLDQAEGRLCGCWRGTRVWAGVLLAGESHRMQRADRRAQRNRWRRERRRVVPSPTAVFRYLDNFHDEAEEARRRSGKAFIPAANDALCGLGKVNSDLVGFAGGHSGHTKTTLDPVSSTGRLWTLR